MYLLRRTAVRAIASPSKVIFVQPRSFTTVTPTTFRLNKQCIASTIQRRFISDEAKTEQGQAAAEAAEAAEAFAQTATEAPVEENLTPAQAEPINVVGSQVEGSDKIGSDTNRPASEGARRAALADITPSKTLYVGNLFYEVNEAQLKRAFSRFGDIDTVKILHDVRGLSRGFGYVVFRDLEHAKEAAKNLDMQIFEGRNLVVQFHRPRATIRTPHVGEKTGPTSTLFIGNMSFEMSDKDLNDLFRNIRNVTDVRVAIDRRTGQPRGFAHADFIDVPSAIRAKETLQEKIVYGRQLRIDFSNTNSRDAKASETTEPAQE